MEHSLQKTGKAVVLAVSGAKPSLYLPDVPKTLPKPMAERFNTALNNALKDSEIQRKIAEMAIEVTPTSLPESEKYYADALAYWANVYKDKPKAAAAK